MPEPEDEQLIQRAQEVADVVPFVDVFQDIADDVDDWWSRGVPEAEIDRRIIEVAHRIGMDAKTFVETVPELDALTDEQKTGIASALRLDEWTIGCVKSIARTGRPLPFIYTIGDVFIDRHTLGDDEKLVWAVATSVTNPEVVAKKFVKQCKATFGDQVTKDMKPRVIHPGQMTPSEALGAHDRGTSYRDIAIQNLRRTYPEIIRNPWKFKREIARERARVVDEIQKAREVWDKRLGDSPTAK